MGGQILNKQPAYRDVRMSKSLSGDNFVIFGGASLQSLDMQISLDILDKSNGWYARAPSSRSGISPDALGSRSIALAGDVNNDNHEDMMIGDPINSRIYVLFGNSSGFYNLNQGFIILGETKSDYLGWSVAPAKDFNRDSFDDIIGCAIFKNACYLWFGHTLPFKNVQLPFNSNKEGIVIIGSRGYSMMGISVGSAGDFNGDGYVDLIISAIGRGNANIVYVLYGKVLGATDTQISIDSLLQQEYFAVVGDIQTSIGGSVTWLGDVNGDGFDDVCFGSVPYRGGYTRQQSYLLFGGSLKFGTKFLRDLSYKEKLSIIGGGIVVSGPGDLNGDGFNDVIITNFMSWQTNPGAYLISFPSNMTVAPTMMPSSTPTSAPQQPSSRPSIRG